jgi:hypothetical protein
MPRIRITQEYTAPRDLTPDEQRALAAAVEAAAVAYLRETTAPWWRQLPAALAARALRRSAEKREVA